MAESKEIVKANTEYAIFKSELTPETLGETLAENLGSEGLSIFSLERIKVPSGGSKTWTVPTLSGEVETQNLEGIIIHNNIMRQYYESDFAGGGAPPDCYSRDGVTGVGNPGGACDKCPLAQYGSANNGKTACKMRRLFFVLLQDSMLPVLLNAPPSSLKEARTYLMKLSSMGKVFYKVITRFVLNKEKSSDGIDYSKLSFQYVADAPNPEMLTAYAKSFKHVVETMPISAPVSDD